MSLSSWWSHQPHGTQVWLGRAGGLLLLLILFLVLRWAVRRWVNRLFTNEIQKAANQENFSLNRTALMQSTRLRTLSSLLQSILIYTVAFTLLLTGLSLLGVNVTGVLGTAGFVGLAFGFGAQKLVKDVISGFFLLLENQYAVGDYVTIGTVSGLVEGIGMRITRVRDDDGKLFILSNGDISQVCNHSRGAVGGSFEVGIAGTADIAQARTVLDTAFVQASEALGLVEAARVEGVTNIEAAKTMLRIRFRAPDTMRPPEAAWKLREVARTALNAAQIPLG